uniref:Transmembrane protein 8B n=3 Tax=Bactrocera latifrons TaxID=174628 RepID=A0A0K8W3X1_BACLA
MDLTKFLAVFVCIISHNNCDARVQMNQLSEEENNLIEEIDEGKKGLLMIPKRHTLVVRLPLHTLLKYTAYKDISILHFKVPADTRAAFFAFKAYEEGKSVFHRKCKPQNVDLHLKAGSYPVISPENIAFPKNFLSADQRSKIYSLQFQSNEKQQHLLIESPHIGDWYAVAFITWTDPSKDRIEQQGLTRSCDTVLNAEMSVLRFQPFILCSGLSQSGVLCFGGSYSRSYFNKDNDSTYSNLKSRNELIYKLYIPSDISVATAHFSIVEACKECPDIVFQIQSNAFPKSINESQDNVDQHNFIHSVHIIKPNQTANISLEFHVQEEAWHYIHVTFFKEKKIISERWKTKLTQPFVSQNEEQYTNTINSSGANFQKEHYEEDSICFHQIKYGLVINFQTSLDASHKEQEAAVINPTFATKNVTVDVSNENITIDLLNHDGKEWLPKRFRGIDFYPLLRQSYREFFMFDYDLMPDKNGTVPFSLNLTAGIPAGFAFDVGEVHDIGGTLTLAVSMKKAFESESIVLKEIFPTSSGNDSTVKGRSRCNKTILVCMHLSEPGIPIWPDKCQYGQQVFPAASIVNNTDFSTTTGLVHVPFPESGRWYISMALYCHQNKSTPLLTVTDRVKDFIKKNIYTLDKLRQSCPCFPELKRCIANIECLNSMTDVETLKVKDCLVNPKCTPNYFDMILNFELHQKLTNSQYFALENCNTSVVFTISSNPCVAGRCGQYGRCYHYMSGGLVFSTCVCMKGYRGWDCSEDSQVPSNLSILASSLLLTLSNLIFLPSICIAIQRYYYTEATIYFFAMVFSILYHACDSGGDEYSFCLVKIGVLQFCDFYCGLLAIWVTLIAMSHIRQQFVSILHMLGAVLLAFGTELNKQSLWVFLAPALTGICLISTSWGIRCYKMRKWYPSPKYLIIYMPLGVVLVMVGLICFAFLQTKQNYHIVHSIWHTVMALSILCLLPSRKYFIPKC